MAAPADFDMEANRRRKVSSFQASFSAKSAATQLDYDPEEIAKKEARFAGEVAMLSRVQHKNLVKFIGDCKEPVMVIVIELLQ